MIDLLTTSWVASLGWGFLALMLWWGVLRFLDIVSGVRFQHDILAQLKTSPLACGVYYGLRCLAAAIVVGLVLSTVRL